MARPPMNLRPAFRAAKAGDFNAAFRRLAEVEAGLLASGESDLTHVKKAVRRVIARANALQTSLRRKKP